MTVKLVGLIKQLDPAAFEDYRSRVGATVTSFRGQVIYRGKLAHAFWNELDSDNFDAFVELEFPTLEDATQWAASADYQELLAVRSRAMRLTLFAVT
ncbi:MAG: hypothetical protein AW11_03637 [Candidatus Accumulibacter regalis]|jgi:uncharacterized protein (DUF1330 family)|uniref:DUF1330 domain-containing protein n=1 Tax=Accumulibacter regalis TaxID=522306 RepID=A0A011R287_ACCRE|nr:MULTISPECIES: DUF1330 domain-containing protein [unclassified Candidatus Accumulibacter]EXI85314.1 MAG: hypothetical protein AW11_03637 [Candidatus Accumulibacter regalis]MQM34494.1 DUF1330 domain-containing protein [Candidatus Accumulibacter phosphatis]MBL8367719.1 DUF1330 domain-containing protein [Accumulibacter sp.]MBN8514098.1 DUF1330 domain-containing protein [Accumulibacter sp.]MBO3702715.1 DUF1330 domain-containing protein [Accumulibacter sp.]